MLEKQMIENYSTVILEDNKGRVTIPVQVRKAVNEEERTAYKLVYDSVSNEIRLIPIVMEQEK